MERGGTCIRDESVTISQERFEAMMSSSPILSLEQRQAIKQQQDERQKASRERANLRKQRMLKVLSVFYVLWRSPRYSNQMEAERKLHQPKTESEILKQEKDKATTRRARELLEEQLDDVKRMNQMVLYAKCAAIRDKQIEEKRVALQQQRTEQQQLDAAMERDRINALRKTEELELERAEIRRAGARIIEQQLQERAQRRQQEGELRRKESEALTRHLEKIKIEDQAAVVRRKEAADRMMKEVAVANQEQIQRKEFAKAQEKEDEKRIMEYLKQRDAREQEELEERERVAKEKELETARLRAQQEKMADKQAELDELRARRYQEVKEKEWREKELETQRKKQEAIQELAKARESQKAAKIRQLGDMARIEQQEFYRVLEVNKAKAAEETAQEAMLREAKVRYKEELKAQISLNDETRKQDKERRHEESQKMKQKLQIEKNKIATIKDAKIRGLRDGGIPENSCSEMNRVGLPVRPQSKIHELFHYSRTLFRTPKVPSEHEIKHSLKLMSNIPLEELGLRNYHTTKTVRKGIEYLGVYEGNDFDIGVFCFSKGCTIPIHDHPQMTVLTRLLYGELRFTSYDLIKPLSRRGCFSGRISRAGVLSEDNCLSFLLPNKSNLHKFEALSNCAILDVLAPPYSEENGRPCNYYAPRSEARGGGGEGEEIELELTSPPWDLSIRGGVYNGIKPESNDNYEQ
eukprot:g2709.t1